MSQGVGQVKFDDDKGKGKGKNKGKGDAKRGALWVAESKDYNQSLNCSGGKGASNQQQKGDFNANKRSNDWSNKVWPAAKHQRQHL